MYFIYYILEINELQTLVTTRPELLDTQQNQLMIQSHTAIGDSSDYGFQKSLKGENRSMLSYIWPFLTLRARISFDTLCS